MANRWLALVPWLVLMPPAGLARCEEPIAGRWHGTIELPHQKLAIHVELEEQAGKWKGAISIPAQQAHQLPLEKIHVEAAKASFQIANIAGAPTFELIRSPDGAAWIGKFKQSGGSFPARLGRDRGSSPQDQAALDQIALRGLALFKVPGVAVAVVRGDQTIYAKGFGQRDIEKKLPVTSKTLFAIGSCTKAFTTFLLAMLAEEGKLDWDKPVGDKLTYFRLKDPVASAQATPRDLVTHRTGMPRYDTMWFVPGRSRRELVEALRSLEPSAGFRAKWQYNNLMYVVAGELAHEVAGKSWEDLVRERIFAPLGIAGANFSVAESQKSPDFAQPYEERNGKIVRVPFHPLESVGPAGSINAHVEDMARWMAVHLCGGKFGSRQLLPQSRIDELHRPHVATGAPAARPDISSLDYALGWGVGQYRGHRKVAHGGGIDGFASEVLLFPDDELGIVVLTNRGGSPLAGLLASQIADRLLGLETIDWMGEAAGKLLLAKGIESAKKSDAGRRAGTKPAHPLDEYAGSYRHPAYGSLLIERKGDRLVGRYGPLELPLEHWHYEVFHVKSGAIELSELPVRFLDNLAGWIDRLEVALEPAVAPLTFAKEPDRALTTPAYLDPLVGDYEIAGEFGKVRRTGERLTLEIPGQPTYTLIPEERDSFAIQGLTNYWVRVVRDKDGAVTGAILDQPNGKFKAQKKK